MKVTIGVSLILLMNLQINAQERLEADNSDPTTLGWMQGFPPTMYKDNGRNSSKFKRYGPLQLSYNFAGKCHEAGYYSYSHR
jgi:hypothetical protein